MNIFYNKQSLKDTMVNVCPKNNEFSIVENENFIYYKAGDEIKGFNIFNVSSDINLPEGRLYLTKSLNDYINKKMNINLVIKTKGFLVGKVLECEHIKDTHLSKCVVDCGNKKFNLVCGAKNVKADLKVVVATTGTLMPDGLLIEPNKLKGIESNAMLCSQKELDITGFNQEGIIELDESYEVGEPFRNVYSNL